jgi:hypothetical protein
MGEGPQPDERGPNGQVLVCGVPERKGLTSAPSDMDRRYPVALLLYVVLALLVWFTMGEGKVLVMGRPVEMRLLPLVIIAGLALRTVLARQAERIRRNSS